MDISDDIAAIERRAFSLRKTMAQVCAEAALKPQAWSRVKSNGAAHPRTLERMEQALDRIEAGA